jgi:hypothetical protein
MLQRHATRAARHCRIAAACLAIAGFPSAACAALQDGDERRFSLDGFGTLGAVYSDERDADFLGGPLTRRGAGYSDAWSAEVDSRLGVQFSAIFSPRISAVLQVISEQRHDGYLPKVEWANIHFAVTPDLDLRVGRTVLPSFLVSDHRKVGFANPWVRPPIELYGMVPNTSSDGVDLEYRTAFGSVSNTLQANAGTSRSRLADGGNIEAEDAWGVTDSVQWGDTTLHLAYQRTDLTIDSINQLFVAFRQFGPPGVAIAERFAVDGEALSFVGVGASHDPGAWFLMGEYGRIRSSTAIGSRASWYVSAGVRRHDFTPYFTWAGTRPKSRLSDPGLDAASFPAELGPTIAGLNGALNTLLGSLASQDSLSLGTRWDFMPSAALKAQVDLIRLGRESAGVLGNLQPDFEPGGNVGLFSVSLDFVF